MTLRPEVVELLNRLDIDTFFAESGLQPRSCWAFQDGGSLTADQQELVASATAPELGAVASQLSLVADLENDAAHCFRRAAQLLEASGFAASTPMLEAFNAAPPEIQAQVTELMERAAAFDALSE